MHIRIDEGLTLDTTAGKVIRADMPKSLPFTTAVQIKPKNINPITPQKKRVGNAWVTSSRLSLAYILGVYMVGEKKEKIAAFYPVDALEGEDQGSTSWMVIEAYIEDKHVKCEYQIVQEDPSTYLEVENKFFDAIFGSTDAKTTDIDIAHLYKSLSNEVKPHHAAIVVACIGVIFLLLYWGGFIGKEEVVQDNLSHLMGPTPLSDDEANQLRILASGFSVDLFKEITNRLNEDVIVRSYSIDTERKDKDVSSTVKVEYASYYPFDGADNTDDRWFKWEQSYTIVAGRNDLGKLSAYVKKTPEECIDILIDDYVVKSRSDGVWVFLIEEKEYEVTARLLEGLYGCPMSIELATLVEGKALIDLNIYELTEENTEEEMDMEATDENHREI